MTKSAEADIRICFICLARNVKPIAVRFPNMTSFVLKKIHWLNFVKFDTLTVNFRAGAKLQIFIMVAFGAFPQLQAAKQTANIPCRGSGAAAFISQVVR
jgi:hypothetical protein